MTDSKKNNWLSEFGKNTASQFGEDGIIDKIFEIIKEKNKWCVEFGAGNGKYLSNTWNLITNKKWSGALIESDKKSFLELLRNYKGDNNAVCIHKAVNFKGPDTLDGILRKLTAGGVGGGGVRGTGRAKDGIFDRICRIDGIPEDFDFLSIDIDGNDYHIWESVTDYKPRVVSVEFNPTIPNDIEFTQPRDMKVNQGSSLLSIVKLGKEKGYELVCATTINAIFVKNEYFNLFGITDNSPEALNTENKKYETRLFQLYDGTLVLTGYDTLRWQRIRIRQEDIQVLPKKRRKYPRREPQILGFMTKSQIVSLLKKVHLYNVVRAIWRVFTLILHKTPQNQE